MGLRSVRGSLLTSSSAVSELSGAVAEPSASSEVERGSLQLEVSITKGEDPADLQEHVTSAHGSGAPNTSVPLSNDSTESPNACSYCQNLRVFA